MELIEKIAQELTAPLADMGYDIVRISIQGVESKTLQLMAERTDRVDMTVEDCARISRTTSALLDVSDPFSGRWMLEVSSPGLDRPLVRESDYTRFAGEEAKVELTHDLAGVPGRKRFKGKIQGFDGLERTVLLDFEGQTLALPYDDIAKAKLILTDELIKKHEKK